MIFSETVDLYEMWLSDHAGRNVRDVLRLMHEEEISAKDIFKSDRYPAWTRRLEPYEKAWERAQQKGIGIVRIFEEAYPVRLKHIYDPPFLLYYRGNLPKNEERALAVVGSRKATEYGLWAAYTISRILGQKGVHIISGMAFGVDTCAHKGAMDGNGKTTAVLGSGADIYSPAANRGLGERILETGGCILSEFLPGSPGWAFHYPRRNRIISGLSEGVIVTEAGERSGTAITASTALEQGREVYAVPGNITSPLSMGTNRLIRDGAVPLLCPEDILRELGIRESALLEEQKNCAGKKEQLSREERELYDAICEMGQATAELLSFQTGRPMPVIHQILTVLEMKGMVFKNRNKIIIAK